MVWAKIAKNKIILLIIGAAFLLRTYKLYDNLFFGWEQGRDFLKYGEILRGDLILVGPKTDIAGFFHGALSYYIFLPLYIILTGNPYLILLSLILFNCLAVWFLFKFSEKLFNKPIAYMASIFYAISYSSIIYNRWLIHENLVPAITIIALYSLVHSTKQPKYLLLFAVSWSVAFHLAIQMSVILLFIFVIFYLFERPKYSKNIVIYSFAILMFFVSPFLIFDIKNHGISSSSLINYLQEEREIVLRNTTFDELKNEITDNVFPSNQNIALSIFTFSLAFLIINKSEKKKNIYLIVLTLLVMPALYYIFAFKPLRHFYIYLSPILSIFLSIFIYELLKNNKFVALGIFSIIVYGNLSVAFKRLPESEANFIHHAQRTYLKDELALIDYVYNEAEGEKFTYNYYSVPYWQPQTWEYLFGWYGRNKYGYEPIINTRTKVFYVVYEPDETQPLYQENWLKDMNKESSILDSFTSGKLTAEKRELI